MTWRASREIVERIVVEGDLVLLTPTSLGNGDSDGLTDISLLLDEVDKTALLTGTSIAGALRNYLRERSKGFSVEELSDSDGKPLKDEKGNRRKDSQGRLIPLHGMTHLFGSLEDDGAQSCLIVDDALSSVMPTTELRDGVKIDGKTRTAEAGKKFDLELLEAGTTFKLRFELLVSEAKDKNGKPMFPCRDKLLKSLTAALQGFEKSEIYLGARKRRGYGQCNVENWKVKYYNLKTKNGLLAWLGFDGTKLKNIQTDEINESRNKPIADAIKEACSLANDIQSDDNREYFELNACFALDGSMLIRSGSKITNEKGQPDTVHLRSERVLRDSQSNLIRAADGKLKKENAPTVSGTSLAGVLRHRAVKICNTLADGKGADDKCESFVEQIFGVDMEKLRNQNRDKGTKEQPFASRLEVHETFIENTSDLVQTRIKIDRFTGGAYEGALFDAAPVFAEDGGKAIELSLKLRSARLTKKDGKPETPEEKKSRTDAEIGLLLLLLKDLWTSDLAIGGESSIGRGRLKGISANLRYRKNDEDSWEVSLKETDNIEVKRVRGNLPNGKTETEFLNDLVGQLKVELEKDNAKN